VSMHPSSHLDECSVHALVQELQGRVDRCSLGYCDYCGQPRGSKPCRYPERHECGSKISEVERDLMIAALKLIKERLP
jgi:hypothetical protein